LKKLALLGGGAGAAVALLVSLGQAADHLDAPGAAANPMADINDLYTWMTTDGNNVIFALTVSPGDPPASGSAARHFGPTVQYVIHANSRAGFTMPPMESKVVCTFASDTDGQCWVINPSGTVVDYVKGDFSSTSGKLSDSGKVKVFAGQRSDPFFFNLGGTRAAIKQTELFCGVANGTPGSAAACPPDPTATNFRDAAGCLKVDATQAGGLRTLIRTKLAVDDPATPCDDTADIDCFKNFNVRAIVVEVDKTLLNQGTNTLLSVWASTHTGS
jgi:hypothetical protein